jgi:hypothetical protein
MGKRPQWVKEMIAANPNLIPKEEIVKAIIYTHPEDPTLTFTYHHKGHKPKWVRCLIDGIPLPPLVIEKKAFVAGKEDDTTLKYWSWRDFDNKPQNQCLVGAYTAKEAMKLLNACFKYAVSDIEFKSCWKEIDTQLVVLNNRTGVFQKNKSNEWEARPVINKVYVKGMCA